MAQQPTSPRRQNRTFSELTLQMQGKWSRAMGDLIPALVQDLPANTRTYRHGPCPVHGGKDGFRFFRDFHETGAVVCNTCGMKPNGFVTIAWYLNTTTKEATKMIGEWIDDLAVSPTFRPPPPPPPVIEPPKNYDKEKAAIQRIASSSQPIAGTLVEYYLRVVRKLPAYAVAYDTLRFVPNMEYRHEVAPDEWRSLGYFGCLIASVRDCADGNKVRTLHRIYLGTDGNKAEVPDPKKSMIVAGTMTGSAVQLFCPGRVLAITEGMETGMSVRAGTMLPVWPTLTAGGMETMNIPDDVELFLIFADKDRSERGFIAAGRLAQRILQKGKQVIVYYPEVDIPDDAKGIDWSDVWQRQGSAGFPATWRYNRKTGVCAWMDTLARTDLGADPLVTLIPEGSQNPALYDVEDAVQRQRAAANEKRLQRQRELAAAEAANAEAEAAEAANAEAEAAMTLQGSGEPEPDAEVVAAMRAEAEAVA